MEFLGEFWDYEKSPYIRELHLQGKSCTTIGDQRLCMIGSGRKTDKVFAHYANHIKKDSALEMIAKTSERLFAPIFEELSITDIEYCICDEAAEEAGNIIEN